MEETVAFFLKANGKYREEEKYADKKLLKKMKQEWRTQQRIRIFCVSFFKKIVFPCEDLQFINKYDGIMAQFRTIVIQISNIRWKFLSFVFSDFIYKLQI